MAFRLDPRIGLRCAQALLRQAEACGTERFRVAVSWDKFKDVQDVPGNFGRVYTKCLYHFFICVLNADGDLCVCMYHLGDKAFSFGNIYDNTLDEIWAGEKRRQAVEMCANRLDLSAVAVDQGAGPIEDGLYFWQHVPRGRMRGPSRHKIWWLDLVSAMFSICSC